MVCRLQRRESVVAPLSVTYQPCNRNSQRRLVISQVSPLAEPHLRAAAHVRCAPRDQDVLTVNRYRRAGILVPPFGATDSLSVSSSGPLEVRLSLKEKSKLAASANRGQIRSS